MDTSDDWDGDYEMAQAVNREVARRTSGQRECYCTHNTVCSPCSAQY